MPLFDGAVLRQRTACLAHQPDRRVVGPLPTAGAKKGIAGGGCVHVSLLLSCDNSPRPRPGASRDLTRSGVPVGRALWEHGIQPRGPRCTQRRCPVVPFAVTAAPTPVPQQAPFTPCLQAEALCPRKGVRT